MDTGKNLNDQSQEDFGLGELQRLIERMYSDKDVARGADATFLWLTEEFGELAAEVRKASSGGRTPNLEAEFADVLAWLATIANILQVDLAAAVRQKYAQGCLDVEN